MMTARLLRISAWLCLLAIVFATVSPIGLRPRAPLPVNLERALAFCLMAGLFVLAYPRRWRPILILTVAGAGFIEAFQFLSPTRHAQMLDAMVKAAGAAAGVAFAAGVNRMRGEIGRALPARAVRTVPRSPES
ncbi:VanZ family protein [Rhizobiaceae bacterium BDR2-2]|uniref:VanZ family protein n=1 Tax=Ectorhizobium quercum TaxID=2965071 RepID=A0AAE3SXA3_9HYPH|nr:VanZ family protein [Ectorhizobium quercum]MCX9000042.1 VanZ family protein [Ectorhizobium quercum]